MLGLGEGYFTFTVESDMRYKVVSRGGYRSGSKRCGNMGICLECAGTEIARWEKKLGDRR